MTTILNASAVPPTFVYLNSSVSNVTGNATPYTILFDTVGYGSNYNTGTGLYTAPISGNYLIVTSFLFTNITSGANGNLSSIVSASAAYRLSESAMTAAKDPSLQYVVNGAIVINLSSGNTAYVSAQLNNGTSAVVGIAGGTSPYNSWFYIKYLG